MELIEIIKKSKMTQTDFSKNIGVSVSLLNMIIRRERQPSYNFLLKLVTEYPDADLKKIVLEAKKKEL